MGIDAFQTGNAVAPRDTAARGFMTYNQTNDANRVQDILHGARVSPEPLQGSDRQSCRVWTLQVSGWYLLGRWPAKAAESCGGSGAQFAPIRTRSMSTNCSSSPVSARRGLRAAAGDELARPGFHRHPLALRRCRSAIPIGRNTGSRGERQQGARWMSTPASRSADVLPGSRRDQRRHVGDEPSTIFQSLNSGSVGYSCVLDFLQVDLARSLRRSDWYSCCSPRSCRTTRLRRSSIPW